MRGVLRLMLVWTLSPLGTVLNAAMLAVVLFLAGADPDGMRFWLPVALYVGVAGFYDVNAYIAQRRRGLSSDAIVDAVFERLWPSREGGEPR